MNDDYTRVGAHLSVLRRRWMILAAFVVLGVGAGLAMTPLERPVYSAKARVLVPNLTGTPLANRTMSDQINVMTSDVVVRDVIVTLGTEDGREKLLGQVDVEAADGSSVLEVTASNGSRREAASIANTFGEVYLATIEEEIDRIHATNAEFYADRVAEVDAQIELAEESLESQQGATAAATTGTIKRLTRSRAELVSALAIAEVPQATPEGGRLLARASVPPAVSAQWFRGGMLGSVIGLILGLIAAYVRDRRDDALHDEGALASRLGSALVLGRIPTDNAIRRGTSTVLDGGRPATVEAFRALSTNVRFLLGDASGRVPGARWTGDVVVVTSAGAGDGKTTVACSLAATAANQGLRVVLVDADLRSPTVSDLFGLEPVRGLSDLLGSDAPADGLLRSSSVPNLRILPAGEATDAADLLASDRVREVWSHLAREADLVVVDTAPLLSVADTLHLVSAADRVVVVVRRGRTRSAQLGAAFTRLALLGATVSGVVFNGVRVKDLDGDGHYYPSVPGARSSTRAART